MLRCSDAIAVGRVLVCPRAGGAATKGSKLGDGCALDMAVVAVRGEGHTWMEASEIWPWLRYRPADGFFPLVEIMVRFDRLVMKGEMTLDQLIDYVRSIEPQETEAREEETIAILQEEAAL